ncbi:Myotubularin- protein 14 [Podila clonocystis]|nr:Myotubularin- protein 14 [Podila clonocystis]
MANVAIKEFVPPTLEAKPAQSDVPDPYKVNDTHELAKQFEKSHFARVRARFVVPCILVRGKNICRSATLSNEVEVFMHSFNQKINDLNQRRKMLIPDKEDRESSLEKQREEDIELLRQLGVAYINDLMVENRKVKYGLKVTSSEKADSFRRYSNFKLVATPYPGVEFFQKFKANKYSARKLCFDWSQNFADAELQLPLGHTDNLGIRWRDYKKWDLIELTQNYLRLYLTHIADGTDVQHPEGSARSSKGLLVHCISGWDRTPLFISLLRISLWADGEAHQSLTAAEILYLTMGYDWFLFNHLLADRSQRGEDIFYFCFYFLKFIYGEEFSLNSVASLGKTQEVQNPVCQQLLGRSPLLKDIGRVRDGVFYTGPELDPNAHICDDCRQSRRFSSDAVGRDANNSHEAASSTDGKPSSWQLVSFATPPGRDRHGSPRAPFLPTLQGASRTNGSPLNTNRNSSGPSEDHKAAEGSLESQRNTSTSPFTFADGRFRLGLQQFNARRSSSSSIPEIFAASGAASEQSHESKRQTFTTGFESSRVSTSPNLSSHDKFGSSPDRDSKEESSTERLSTPRKRASTFDGSLLLSTGTESLGATHSKEEEEDLTSGDDDADEDEEAADKSNRGLEAHQQPAIHPLSTHPTTGSTPQNARLNQYTCQVCHQAYEPLPEPVGFEDPALSQDIPRVTPVSRPSSTQLMEGIHGTNSIFHHDDDDTHGHGYHDSIPQRRKVSESDREEGVFHLDFDDRLSYHGLDTFNEVTDFRPEQISLPGSDCHGSSGSDRGTDDRALCNDLREDDDDDGIECDGNESFWEESSTVDYGYSASPLNGLGLGLTKCSTESLRSTGLDVAATNHSSDPSLERSSHDIEDDDDYGEDDDAASICSQRSGQKSEHHDNDHLFMPSLKGVFSSSDRGQVHGSHGESNGSCATGCPVSDPEMAQSSDPTGSRDSNGPRPTLTRRQKLRQLRRLFMDIRGEIGDGSRSMAGGSVGSQDNSKSGIAIKAGQEQERDGDSNSFKAESFSEDPSFQYKSPIAAYMSNHHRQIPRPDMHDYQQPQFARVASHRPYGDAPGGIVSPVASRDGVGKHPGHHAPGLGVPSSSGRKSPFEWAAAAASSAAASITSSASGIVSGGFGHHPPHGPGMTKQSPHPLYEQYLQQHQQQRHHHQPQPRRASRPYPVGSSHALPPTHMQSPVSGTTTPMDEFSQTTIAGERHHILECHHRASVSPATTSAAILNPKHRPGPDAKDKSESGGRWDWMPGIFV